MNPVRNQIQDIVARVQPHDETEAAHRQDILDWIASGEPLFRTAKPDIPPKHLVSYFVLYDEATDKLLLIDHVKAQAWLPTGGHVDLDEDPRDAAIREASEELKIDADFGTRFGNDPLFVTVTTTKGPGTHVDVSLWYVIRGDSQTPLAYYDEREMNAYRWLLPAEILALDISELDPHMHRFVRKLQSRD